jgi:hypothetical protein
MEFLITQLGNGLKRMKKGIFKIKSPQDNFLGAFYL